MLYPNMFMLKLPMPASNVAPCWQALFSCQAAAVAAAAAAAASAASGVSPWIPRPANTPRI